MDIQEVINQKTAELIGNGTFDAVISKAVETAVTDAIKSQFGSYGPIRKQLDELMTANLKINPKDIAFAAFTEQMNVAIKAKMGGLFVSLALEKFNKEIDQLLAPAPASITLVDLVQEIACLRARHGDFEDEIMRDSSVLAHVYVDTPSWAYRGSTESLNVFICFGDERKKDGIELFLINGKIRINHSFEYNPTIFDPAGTLIFKLYAAGTEITEVQEWEEYIDVVD